MKKYLTMVFIVLFAYFSIDYLVYYKGDLYIPHNEEVTSFTKVADKELWLDSGDGFEVFDMKGVNIGLGMPGKFATEYAITKEEYVRWFEQIQDLGANVIRTYTIAHEAFYDAFYEYNVDNPTPLYLVHGVWVDEYLQKSHRNAFDEEFYEGFLTSTKDVVDVVHGRHKRSKLHQAGAQTYKKDISPWVYGYIIGVEWEADIVAFTNETGNQLEQFKGDYLYTESANNFEIFLAQIGDKMIAYETSKYGTQRTLAFSNWPTTDPFEYPENVALEFEKFGLVDTDHIKAGTNFIGGQYASYHVYPYYPEFLHFVDDTIENTFLTYLEKLVDHHEMPVIISEFGVPSSRGMASYEQNRSLGRDQGGMSEKDQGHAIISLYQDIKESGCAGAVVFVWHDEWFKRTWNTVPYTDLDFSAYWSDYQTNEQYFGLLSFDPGEEESIAYVDGDKSDWNEEDVVIVDEDYQLSMKYDQKFIYFLAEKEDIDFTREKLYIPIDLTPLSGSEYMEKYDIKMSHPTDFMIEIDNQENSRVWVQERYDSTDAIYGENIIVDYNPYEEPPEKDSTVFEKIRMAVHELDYFENGRRIPFSKYSFLDVSRYNSLLQTVETGKLTYGNANPQSAAFNSLADFYFGDDFVEIKIPWGLLNFSDPVEMKVHGDYYENYGVDHLKINSLHVGLGSADEEISMVKYELERLGRKPEYHERLKESYYLLQDYWTAQ